ncbi:hydroxyethylthiazole kinase [Euryarchaeota archaeon ex4484_178]|nr:MAG: hydroxyethylthiazole kinase [Euryarchaeota archaeon ex4484_178]
MEWIGENLEKVRRKNPLVQNITNFVVMNTTANALLAIGASPVMAHAPQELEDMVNIADALVINIGTLDSHWVESMRMAVKIANSLDKPVVLDPVGAGATKYRTQIALSLLENGNIKILRGNFSEIQSLLGSGKTKGVDALGYEENIAKKTVIEASERFGTTVALTGKTDFISDGKRLFMVDNGTPMLGKVTGTGCMVTSIMGAFITVATPLEAAVSTLVVFGIAAEKAFEEAKYPGSFHVKLYDWLYQMDKKLIYERKRVRKVELEE